MIFQKLKEKIFTWYTIVGYPMIHYSAMLPYVPWAIWLGKSRNHN